MDRPGSVQFYDAIDSDIKSKIPELTGAMVHFRTCSQLPISIVGWSRCWPPAIVDHF